MSDTKIFLDPEVTLIFFKQWVRNKPDDKIEEMANSATIIRWK